eukprot:CFRG4177T1
MRPDQHKQKRSRQYQQNLSKKTGGNANSQNKTKGGNEKQGPKKVNRRKEGDGGKPLGSNSYRYNEEPEDYSLAMGEHVRLENLLENADPNADTSSHFRISDESTWDVDTQLDDDDVDKGLQEDLASALRCIPLCQLLNTDVCQTVDRVFSIAKVDEWQQIAVENMKARNELYPNYIPIQVSLPIETDMYEHDQRYTTETVGKQIFNDVVHETETQKTASLPSIQTQNNPSRGISSESDASNIKKILSDSAPIDANTDEGVAFSGDTNTHSKEQTPVLATETDDLEDWLDSVLDD